MRRAVAYAAYTPAGYTLLTGCVKGPGNSCVEYIALTTHPPFHGPANPLTTARYGVLSLQKYVPHRPEIVDGRWARP